MFSKQNDTENINSLLKERILELLVLKISIIV